MANKKLNIYKVYLESGDNTCSVTMPAASKKEAIAYVEGNGEVITVKDITADFPIHTLYLREVLTKAGYGETETDIICRVLENNLANWIDH